VGSSPLSRTLTVGNIRLLGKTSKLHGQPTVCDKQENKKGSAEFMTYTVYSREQKFSVFKKDNFPNLTERRVITCVSGVDRHLGIVWNLHDPESPVIVRKVACRSYSRDGRMLPLIRRKEFLLKNLTKCLNYLTNRTKIIRKPLILCTTSRGTRRCPGSPIAKPDGR
jgi:hypothetical protein